MSSMLFIGTQSLGADLLCPTKHYKVEGHYRKSYVKTDGTVVKESNVKTYCKPFSKEYEYLKDRFKSEFPRGWPHRQEKVSKWTQDEKERFIEALNEMPDQLLIEKVFGFYRFKKSKDFPNPATSADGIVSIYDSAFDSTRNLTRILAHELSHQLFWSLTYEEQQDYRRVTGWSSKLDLDGIIYWIGRRDGYIKEDGKSSHQEDFANNIEYFLFDPDKLKKVTPTAYKWIQQHFGDSFKIKKEGI